MNARRSVRTALSVLVGCLLGCASEPRSYEECLVAIESDRSVEEVQSLCREAFPPPSPFYEGTFYYPASESCGSITFDAAGYVGVFSTSFCAFPSGIDCDDEGEDCRLVCESFNQSDSTKIFRVTEAPADQQGGLLLESMASPGDGTENRLLSAFLSDLRLYSRRSACETVQVTR